MPTVIGIDEAGYGPMLGPLVVCAAAFDVPGDDPHADLWQLLRPAVCKSSRSADKKLFVADSKIIYSGGQGLDQLERSILAFLSVLGIRPASFRVFLEELAEDAADLVAEPSWLDISLPSQNDPARMAAAAELAAQAQQTVPFRKLAVQAVNPAAFNHLVGRHGNKATLLFQQNMILVERMMHALPGDLHFICDKHGGRHYYADLLANNFFGSLVYATHESPESSSYEVRLRGRTLRLTFMEKADRRHLPAALASMTCKYVRELFMLGFNTYWCGKVDGLAPTAGYRDDCHRFIDAIRPLFTDGDEGRTIRERG